MAPKRSIQKKRQSKLAFSPVPASSSGANTLSPQVRARAAAVTLQDSPSRPNKKRKLDFGIVRGTRESSDSDSDIPLDRSHALPTPNKSFPDDSESARKRAEERSMREGMPILSRKNGMFGSSDNEHFGSSSSSSDTDDSQRQPIDLTPKKSGRKRAKDNAKPAKKGARIEQPRSSRSKPDIKLQLVSGSDSEELEELQTVRSTRSSKGKEKRTKAKKADAPPTRPKKAPAVEIPSDSGDSDTMPDTSPPPRPGRRSAKRKERADSFEVPDDVVEAEDSEDDVAPRSTQKRRKLKEISDDDEEESEEEAPRSTAKRLIRRKGSGRDRQEEEDLNADLDFLQSSPPPDKGRLRSTNSKPLNERQKALEALKKRRASSQAEPSSSAPPRSQRPVVPSDSDSDLEIIEEEEEGSNAELEEEESDGIEDDNEEEESYSPKALEVFYENENDAGFIDDDEGPLGEPADIASIPIAFTSLSRAKTKDLFKYAVEWMVQKKINPAFSSTDEIYDLTWRKLNDEVSTLANSKYSSSAWTADFTRALRARPEMTIDEISRSERMVMEPHCEACNRKTHPATFNVHLSGKPYHKESLEPLADDSSDSSSDSNSSSSSSSDSALSSTGSPSARLNGEKPTYDAQGEQILPESKIFTLGSTCKANAQMAHTLHHWRFHLNSWVVDYLVRTGHCAPQKLVERDSWSRRKRERYANKVVDEMERVGEVRKLHRLYKEQVDFALEASNEYKRGWGRRG